MSRAVDSYMAYKFVKNLSKPFEKWKAYELGLIDDNGDIIREPQTPEEKKEITPFMNIIRNCKKLIRKFPGGKTFSASLVSAMLLLKENEECEDPIFIFNEILRYDRDLSLLTNQSNYKYLTEELESENYILKKGVYRLNQGYISEKPMYVRTSEEQVSQFFAGIPYFVVQELSSGKNISVLAKAIDSNI